MASSKRITIDVDGIPRRVVSIFEGNDGSVYLSHKRSGLFGMSKTPKDGPMAGQIGKVVVEDRLSIHPTTQEDFNVIKNTLRFDDGSVFSSMDRTHAIKSGSGAAFLFTRRFPTLRNPEYEVDHNEKNISLGTYDPSKFSLVTSMFVCDPDHPHWNDPDHFLSSKQILVGNYKLIVVWSYLSAASPHEHSKITLNLRPAELPENFESPGIPTNGLEAFFNVQAAEIREQFRTIYGIPPDGLFYVKEPSAETEEFRRGVAAAKAEDQLIAIARYVGMPEDQVGFPGLQYQDLWKRMEKDGK